MSERKRIDRERLKVYLLNLLLAFRPVLLIGALLLLVFAGVVLPTSPAISLMTLMLALLLALISYSYIVALYTARLGAWLGTIRKAGH